MLFRLLCHNVEGGGRSEVGAADSLQQAHGSCVFEGNLTSCCAHLDDVAVLVRAARGGPGKGMPHVSEQEWQCCVCTALCVA